MLAVALATPQGPLSARPHAGPVPSTGLRAIALDRAAPDFSYDVGSGVQRLAAARGHAAVIAFWDTWCHPCADELPVLARLRRERPQTTLITLSDERPGIARAFVRDRQLDVPVVEDADRRIFDRYTVHAIPVSIVVRWDGTVASVFNEAVDWNGLTRALDAAERAP